MNEILAIVMFAFYAEKVEKTSSAKIDSIVSEEDALRFILDEKFMTADIYAVFSWIMDLGVKELFGTNTDVSAIKEAFKMEESKELFQFESEWKQAEVDRKARIEQIFDEERKKSAVLKRCNRMYH